MSSDQSRSTFVTVVAWIFIVISGFTLVMSLLQNIMFILFFEPHQIAQAPEEISSFAQFIFNNIQFSLIAMLCIITITFVSSIGLLKRKEWARKLFIGIMVIWIIWNIGSLIMSQTMMNQFPPELEVEMPAEFKVMERIITIFTAVFTISLSGLFAWIIKKLSSGKIQKEFKASKRNLRRSKKGF